MFRQSKIRSASSGQYEIHVAGAEMVNRTCKCFVAGNEIPRVIGIMTEVKNLFISASCHQLGSIFISGPNEDDTATLHILYFVKSASR